MRHQYLYITFKLTIPSFKMKGKEFLIFITTKMITPIGQNIYCDYL